MAHTGVRRRRVRAAPVAMLLFSLISCAVVSPAAFAANTGATTKATALMLVRAGSSSTVFILTSRSCTTKPCLKLLRTDNEARSSTAVTLPPVGAQQGAPMGDLERMIFVNQEEGFISEVSGRGSILYETLDGARSWYKVSTPKDVDVGGFAATTKDLYLVTMRCSKQKNGNEGCLDYRLARSSLKARVWKSTPLPNGKNYPWGFLGNVVAFGDRVWTTEGAKWYLLVSSHNSGRTMTTSSSRDLMSVAGCELSAESTTALWAECPTGMQDSFASSTNGGATWRNSRVGQFMGTGGGWFDPVSSDLAVLDYGGTGQARNIFRMTSSSAAVTPVGHLSCTGVTSMVFLDESEGLAACSDGRSTELLRTTDGGASWGDVALS